MNINLVLGAALHWSSLLYAINSSSLELTPLLHFIVFLCMLAVTAASHVLERRSGRLALVLASAVSGVLLLLILVFPTAFLSAIGTNTWLFDFIVALNVAPPIILWGFAFSSLDKRAAAFHAMLTGLLAIAFTAVVYASTASDSETLSLVRIVERLVSCLFALSDRTGFSSTHRSFDRTATPAVARFVLGRVVLGAAIGIYYFHAASTPLSLPSCILVTALSVAGMAFLLHHREQAFEGLPIFPLLLVGLACLPLACSGYSQIVSQVFSIVWLCWIFTSSVQLSGLKETFSMSEARLSSGEKAAIMLGWTAGIAVAHASPSLFLAEPIPLVVVYLAVVWGVWSCYRCAHNRIEDELISRREAERQQRMERALDALCERHGLTEREREVAELLSSGLDRKSICQKLCISDGTVRAHSTHIYQKLDIHSREELTELVERTS